MDRIKAKSIFKITESLHNEATKIYEALMDSEFKDAEESIDSMIESLKHLKTNMKQNEV